MRVIWAVLCRQSLLDRDTNNVSLIDVIEEIQISAIPPQVEADDSGSALLAANVVELIVLFGRSEFNTSEKGRGRLRLLTPNGTSSSAHEFEVDLTNNLKHRFRLKIPGIPIQGEGIYYFLVDCKTDADNWEEKFALPLEVNILPQLRE